MAQSSEGTARKRGPGRPFKPGQSGNPGGRPKGIASEARRLSGKDGRKYLKILDSIATDESAKTSDRIECIKIGLDRGWGKSPAFAPIEGGDPLERDQLDEAIGATLDDLAERREAQAARGGEAPALATGGEAGAASTG